MVNKINSIRFIALSEKNQFIWKVLADELTYIFQQSKHLERWIVEKKPIWTLYLISSSKYWHNAKEIELNFFFVYGEHCKTELYLI